MRFLIAAATLYVSLNGHIALAQDVGGQAQVLRCEGRSISRAIDAPANAFVSLPEDVQQSFVVEARRLRVFSPEHSDAALTLCSETSTVKVFSDACGMSAQQFFGTWKSAKSNQTASTNLHAMFNRVEINHATLHAHWLHLLKVIPYEPDMPPPDKFYFIEDIFDGRCLRAKVH